jgi:transcriptional regulator with XRE-family HTH domain
VAARFRKFRERLGLRQDELARLIDVRREEVSKIENAHVYPISSTLRRFAALEARGDSVKQEIQKIRKVA